MLETQKKKEFVLDFNKLTVKEQFEAGGKGGALAKLYQAGYPVPKGIVIMPTAFVGDELRIEAWEQVKSKIRQMQGKRKHNNISFAVRSSALAEDSSQASFAGEFETVLDVSTDQAILDAIIRVRKSRYSKRVKAYSQAKGMDSSHEIAVVVQQLVQADITGILFTADPVSGNRFIMTGSFTRGLGDKLVSGEVTGETFTLKDKGNYEGPSELAKFAKDIYKLGKKLERELGCPQDIEWCIAGGKLYLLQSRPITTMIGHDPSTGEWNDTRTGDYLWMSFHLAELFPQVMTPATWSVWRSGFFGQKVMGFEKVGNICGRPYLNMSLMYSIMSKQGKDHETIQALLEEEVGTIPEPKEIPIIPMSRTSLLKALWDLGSAIFNGGKMKKKYLKQFDTLPQTINQLIVKVRETRDKNVLISLWHDEVQPFFSELVQSISGANDDYFDPFTAARKKLNSLLTPDETNELLAALAGGSEDLSTIKTLVGLAKVTRGELSRDQYLSEYGHRSPYENEISQPRPSEDPQLLDKELTEFQKSGIDIETTVAKRSEDFEAKLKELSVYPSVKAKDMKFITKKLDEHKDGLHKRESLRSEFTRVIGAVRQWFLQASELICIGDDIFFLMIDEVLDLLAGDDSALAYIPARKKTHEKYQKLPPYPPVIVGQFNPFQWAKDPNRQGDYFNSHGTGSREIHDKNTITGQAGSAGQAEGIVRFIKRPEDGDQLQPGEILLATTTNVGWTSLFPRAAAVITDVGTKLSHAAIVARELEIPAVIGTGSGTTRLKTGDRVFVDGSRGIVKILGSA
ncbi:MAG: PEP/pyruvate-binding domain-containing protein [Candidatus Odinarchaeota archaeon]